ncbi:hypothetical protein E0W69_018290 [Rhizosphaericola mali]|uniref:Uncharacterized protein n=2 Tax=Rhizosphaericola mali TaxID=2545455 RepID=A0A5P2GBD1_9BACT|nr:hypothetical protein E0W69_018290 [Rhizosphaericola mali]
MFLENTIEIGYEVLSLSEKLKFKYPSNLLKFFNGVRKLLFKDKNYKKRLIKNYQLDVVKKIQNDKYYTIAEYALIIRPDLWHHEVISEVVKLAKVSVCYQWDGIKRYPDVVNYFSLFTKIYVFDPKDLYQTNFNIKLLTNFYFDNLSSFIQEATRQVCYIGTFQNNRITKLLEIKKILKQYDIFFDIFLAFNSKKEATSFEYTEDVNILQQSLSYKQMIGLSSKYKVIVDVQNKFHEGLSFRHFECLKLEKKIITDNASVKGYDFYKSNNVFVFGQDNPANLSLFINSEFEKINFKIIEKYSYQNWLRDIFV